MSLRRIAGIAVAAAVVSGAGVLLASGTSAATTPPTPITLEATGMNSPSCPALPVGLYHSIALKPATVVQFKQGALLAAATSESLTIKPAPNSTDPNSNGHDCHGSGGWHHADRLRQGRHLRPRPGSSRRRSARDMPRSGATRPASW